LSVYAKKKTQINRRSTWRDNGCTHIRGYEWSWIVRWLPGPRRRWDCFSLRLSTVHER